LVQALLSKLGIGRNTPPPHTRTDFNRTFFNDFMDRLFSLNTFTNPHSKGEMNVPVKPRGSLRRWLSGKYDPRKNIDTILDRVKALWHHRRNQTAQSYAAVATMPFVELDVVYKTDRNDHLMNVSRKDGGPASLYFKDVMETLMNDLVTARAENRAVEWSYNITDEQAVWVDRVLKFFDDARALERKYGLFHENEEDNGDNPIMDDERNRVYFPRDVMVVPDNLESIKPRRSGIGAKPSFTKTRIFETEADGVRAGFRYNPSPSGSMRAFAEKLYRSISDKLFLTDPVIESKMAKRSQVEHDLKMQYGVFIREGKMTVAQRDAAVANELEKRRVNLPGKSGLVFESIEDANAINQMIKEQMEVKKSVTDQVNNVMRAAMLTGDLSAFGVQLQALMNAQSMPTYVKTMATTMKALAKPGALRAYALENYELLQEYAMMGGTIGGGVDVAAGMERDQWFAKRRSRPVRRLFSKLSTAFVTPIDVAKLEFYKAARVGANPNQLPEITEQVDNLFGTARTTGIGISHNQNLFERKALFAPRYYRSAVNNFSALWFEKGPRARIAWETLGNVSTSLLFAYYAMATAAGMDDDEIERRLNPFNIANPKSPFLSVDMQFMGGTYTMGVGGVYFSMLRLAQKMLRTAGENPEHLAPWNMNPATNPVLRWLIGHVSPAVQAGATVFRGETFMGEEITLPNMLIGHLTPIAVQETFREGVAAGTATFFGFNAWRHGKKREWMNEAERIARDRHDKPYADLSISQMNKISQELNKRPEFKDDPNRPSTRRHKLAYIRAGERRLANMRKKVDPDIVAAMDSMGLKLGSYDPVLTMPGGVEVPLPRQRQREYEGYIAEEYNRRLTPAFLARISKLDPDKAQDIANKNMEKARSAARLKLKRAMR
jgi:hypothetical protein